MDRVEPDQARIAWTESGSGQPVVLLHASASSSAQWQDLTRALESRYTVLAPDLHGHGDSPPWRGPGPLSLADEAAIVTMLADHAGEPIHLVGHSYGAAVALRFAQAYPERLRSLVLIEPAAFHLLREDGPGHAASLAEIEDLANAVARTAEGAAGDMRHFVDFWNGDQTWSRMSERSRDAINGRARIIADQFNAIRADATPLHAYAAIRVPVLIVHGSRSPTPMTPIVVALSKILPQARMHRVFGAGHMLPITHPKAVNPAIVAHLDDAASTAALQLRRLDGSDLPEVSRHLLALDRVDRNARFGVVCNDEMIISYCQRIIASRSVLFGAIDKTSGHIVALAEAHPTMRASRQMELAVSVDQSHRRRGLARRLVGEAVAGAFARGADAVTFFFDPRNKPVVGLARQFPFRIDLVLERAELHRGDAAARPRSM